MKVQNNLTYVEIDDTFNLDMKSVIELKDQIGIWGHRHANYLKEYYYDFYFSLLCSRKLYERLVFVEEKANQMYRALIDKYSKNERITEELKEINMSEWLSKMKIINDKACEKVYNDVVCSIMNYEY